MFGMYTYMPYSGFGYSPFGYTYYSPTTVVYAPSFGGSGYAYGGGASRINGLSGASRLADVATHRGATSGGALTAGVRSSGGSFSHAASFGGGHSSGGGHR
jgi:hypothetical protein